MSEKRFNRIEDAEIKAQGVQSLPIRPNASSQYGQGGLSGKQLQARFDRLAGYIIKKYNDLVDGLASHDVLEYFKLPEGYELSTLSDLLSRVTDKAGDLVVDSPYGEGKESVASIVAKLCNEIDELYAQKVDPSKYVQAYIGEKGTINIKQVGVPLVPLEYEGHSGGEAYLSTEQTFTRGQLRGGTATINNNYGANPRTISITNSMITEETEDGICVLLSPSKYSFLCIISAYTTNYQPSFAKTPCPAVGTYLSYWNYYDAEWVESINVEVVPTTYINNALIDLRSHPDYPSIPETPSAPTGAIKLYKHNVYINSGRVGQWQDEAKIYLSYVSTSDTPITTLVELIKSPAVAMYISGGSIYYFLQYAYASYDYADVSDGSRDVDRITLTDKRITIYYITAYTAPASVTYSHHEHGVNNKSVIITDTVMEV